MTAPTLLTPVDVANRIHAELDDWDHDFEFDVTVGGCRLTIAYDGFTAFVEHISAPADALRRGYGTAVLAAVTEWADRNWVTLRLCASEEFGTSRAVLEAFYGRHGFEYVNRIGMVRQPTRAVRDGRQP